ncbi:hypothetical protein B296_00019393 [Ensete ventricosum]|uniref:Uncharacterized protein n=1 Tax=Ensete ventricosum TaxID=4639 RepID=A0A427A9J2_ENSVE|nr:hypothetical protein B296_00019393 [Ensete ventricosum]
MFMDLFVQKIQDPSSSILSSVDSSQKLSLVDAMVGVVRYLIVAVPDTFVALECFPLSSNVVPDLHYRNTFLKLPECVDNVQFDTRDAYLRYLSCGYVVSSIQKRAFNLSKIVNPSLQAHGAAKVLLALDRALITGNVMIAYNSLFEDFSDVAVEERWIAEISPCLRSSLKWIGTIGLSLICSIFFLCEWATCDHRNFHTSLPNDLKLTGRKDFSQIYFAVLLLKLKMEDLLSLTQSSDGNILLFGTSGKTSSDNDTLLDGAVVENVSVPRNNTRSLHDRKSKREIFQGPGPLHDIIVCWLDQHEIGKAGSFRCVEIFLVEIIRNGIFFPHAYVRQLIASGIMDKNESLLDMERQRRHRRILQQLPGSCLFDVLEEARTTEVRLFYEFVHTYSNERRLLLRGLLGGKSNLSSSRGDLCSVFSMQKDIDSSSPGRAKTKDKITQLKVLISRFLRFSLPFAMSMETCPDDSQGNSKRTPGSLESKVDLTEETPGCEECRKGKLQKLVDDRSSAPEGSSSSHSDDEDTWWVKKGSKSQESFKVELPLKSAKHASRGRQKTVRKTQSLAQLAAARIESSQGASTSHVCDNKVSCPHHRPVTDSEVPKEAIQMISGNQGDIDLLPEALTASIHRSLAMITSNGRPYGDVTNVSKWEKSFRVTCDQRVLAELDTGRVDGEFMFSPGVSAGIIDADEHIRQRMNGRMSRIGTSMKELVQRHVEEAVHYFYGKERKLFVAPTSRIHSIEKWDDVYQIAHDIVFGLVECIRQNGGASIEGDPSVVASAVSAIIGSIGLAVVKLPDFTTSSNYQAFPSSINSLNCVRQILQIHIASLCLLKDALGDRLSRVFEIALAAEASSAISITCAPGKAHRNQFQLSPETNELYQNHSNELLNNSTKLIVGKAAKAAAAVSALVLGAIVRGVSSLDRMITAFRLKEGLDVLQFIRSARSSSNGISRTIGIMKLDYCIEVYVHWFRLLVGNCRTVFDGLVAEMLGESYILSLLRMQQLLPLSLVFPPAYSIFAMVIWRPYILNSNIASREDIQLYQCFSTAIGDAIRHKPFREVFFQNIHGFYDLLTNDSGDSEFAAMLELHNPDKHLKTMAFVPLRARLFLNALIDCKMPAFTVAREDGSWVAGPAEPRSYAETEASLLDKLIHVLDTLQPAKFHWQWLELRLLLNEQALIEKIETHNMPFVEAIRSLSPSAENFALSESEKKFTEIILTRILARPEAAPLYSEVVHLLGKLLQESLVMDTKWILAGPDVLLGRKSIRQQLVWIAQRKGFPTKARFWKPWGWSSSLSDIAANRGEKRKFEAICVEEGEVVDESIDVRKSSKVIHSMDAEGCSSSQQYITEKALAELILPCIDRSSSELRNLFASELIKQMGAIDQQINTVTSNGCKSSVNPEASSNKGSSRKVIRGGSPVLGRRPTDSAPPSAAALKTSLCLRLQFLLRLLPIIYEDR